MLNFLTALKFLKNTSLYFDTSFSYKSVTILVKYTW